MLFYISILGFLIALLLIYYAGNHYKGNYYLGAFFLINNLFVLTNYAVFFSNSVWLAATMHGHFMAFYYLIGPFCFIYVRSIVTDNYRLSKKDLLHFIPFFITLIGILPYTFSDFHSKTLLLKSIKENPANLTTNINFIVPQTLHLILRPVQMLFYFFMAYRLFYSNRKVISNKKLLTAIHFRHVETWIQLLLIFSIIITMVILGINLWGVLTQQHLLFFNTVAKVYHFIFSSYIVINAALLFFPEVMYGIPRKKEDAFEKIHPRSLSDNQPEENLLPEEISTGKPMLSDDYIFQLQMQIEEYLQTKPFRNHEFSLTSMSFDLKIPLHHLSYYFNVNLQNSFTNWRNGLRITYAMQLLDKGLPNNLTLFAIATESGFSSQSTFIRAFKKATDFTPGEYMKLHAK